MNDKWLKQLDRHFTGQAALVNLQLGPHNDDRTARIVHPLTQQVLAEPSLFPFDDVRQGFEWPIVRTNDRTTAPTVINECVDGLLEHPLFVSNDDFRGKNFL